MSQNDQNLGAARNSRNLLLESLKSLNIDVPNETLNDALTTSDLKDMPPDQQFKSFLSVAVKNNNVPWEQKLKVFKSLPPFNYGKGSSFSGINLVAASLHMAHINSNDPRYLTEDKISDAGLKIKDDAIPLKLAYRETSKNGSYITKSAAYYNAKDIQGLPELRLPPLNPLHNPTTIHAYYSRCFDGIPDNMAGFIAAVSSNNRFEPSSQSNSDYADFINKPFDDICSSVNKAYSEAKRIVNNLSNIERDIYEEHTAEMEDMDMEM
jgi:hypothetical protein